MDSEESGASSYLNAEKRIERINHSEEIDAKYGFAKHRTSVEKVGWLVNFQSVSRYFYYIISHLANYIVLFLGRVSRRVKTIC